MDTTTTYANDDHFTRFSSIPKLKCILFAEFDPDIGPVITYQVPCQMFTKQRFDTFSAGIITKPELFNRLIKTNLPDLKLMGYPVGLDHEKYQRNSYIFNLCFVVENRSHIDYIYESLVQKCAQYLVQLELECEFLHDEKSKNERLPPLMRNIFDGLNSDGECSVPVTAQTTVHLKLSPTFRTGKEPPSIKPYMVPIFTRQRPPVEPADLPKLDVLSQKNCLEFVRPFLPNRHPPPAPCFPDVFRLYASLKSDLTLKQWCKCMDPRSLHVDERKLIQFGLVRGFVTKLSIYPVYNGQDVDGSEKLNTYCDGSRSLEDLCLLYSKSPMEMLRQLKTNNRFVFLTK